MPLIGIAFILHPGLDSWRGGIGMAEISVMTWRVRCGLVAAALAMTGCGGAAVSQASMASPSVGVTTAPPASPAGPVDFTSTIYPYSLTLPAEAVHGAWRPATQEWDGAQRIDSTGPFVDSILVDDGTLLLYGTPWAEGLEAFGEMAYTNGVEHHACSSSPDNVRDLEVAGEPALLYTMRCTGMPVARAVWVREGYGLTAVQLLNSDDEQAVDRLVERLDRLIWPGA